MNIVEHSKCIKCLQVMHLSNLQDNPEGIGMVCKDSESCKQKQTQTIQRSNNHEKNN